MSIRTKRFIALGSLTAVVVALALVLSLSGTPSSALAQTAPTATQAPTAVPTPTLVVPFVDQWRQSPHNDVESEAFAHWNDTEDQKVEVACAACHSGTGYVDFLGGDRSAAGVVNTAPAIGSTVTCAACHNQAAGNLTAVTFLSTEMDEEGEEQPVVISGLGPEARCMVCHQGRATKTQVDARIAQFEAEGALDDVVEPVETATGTNRFGFINIHYYAAAVTLYGNEVHGGYEYDGMAYDARNNHVPEFDTCVECHDPHTTQVRVSECAQCHTGKTTVESLRTIREVSSSSDYDGDGNLREGMQAEIQGLQTILLDTIKAYAADVVEVGITYDSAAHPYWFTDADNDGTVDTNDEGRNVAYTTFTPRLMKAAYNYQVSLNDPGAYAHGNKYIIQLMHDSIMDLTGQLDEAVSDDVATMVRDDAGHFAGNSEAFRHWDAEGGMVPGSCARCHSAAGLPQFVANGANIAVPASNGFQCTTCHTGEAFPTAANQELLTVNTVPFPSGAQLGFGEEVPSNLCLECHQGRESKVSVDRAIGDADDDTASESLRFRNVHYFVAGATLFGTEAKGIYEYDGKEYAGRFEHVPSASTCADCHDAHILAIDARDCAGCHQNQPLEEIRMGSTEDYDGDGDVEEGLAGEVETLSELLLEAIQTYTEDELESGILYDSHAYPYWFLDADNDGDADTNENGGTVGFNAFSPRLLKAAYNYQYVQKDPGAYAHNAPYVIQALYDTLEDLGHDVSDLVRPEVEAEE